MRPHNRTQSVKNSSNLGKVYTEEQLAKLNEEEVEKLFNNYEAKLSRQMVKHNNPQPNVVFAEPDLTPGIPLE